MIKFNVPYQNRVTYPIRADLFFSDLCDQVGLEVGSLDFVNANYMILGNPFTNNEDCRQVLSEIAQLAGGFAKIGRDNKVYIISLNKSAEPVEVIDGNNYFTDFSKNEEYGEVNCLVLSISQVEGENSTIQDDESIQENGLTEIEIQDNSFLIERVEREKVITPLWNNLNGLKYTPFSTKYYGFPYLDSGDCIAILDAEDVQHITYVLNHTFTFNGSFDGELDSPALTKTQVKYKNTNNTKTKFKNVEFKIDKINGQMSQIIEEQSDTEDKISEIVQTVDELDSKVSTIADITISKESAFGLLEFEKINHGEPFKIIARSVGTNIIHLHPRTDLYPNNNLTLLSRDIVFYNKTTEETFKYSIPDDLLYYDEDNYDEFTLDYESKTCTVYKKVGMNNDGTTYKLITPKRDTYEYPKIELTDGDYEVSLPYYNNAYLFVKLMAQNDFTTLFASKVDVSSEIQQTADEINTEVRKKVGEDEIISKINQSAEGIAIQGRKLSLEGYTTINGGFSVDENGNASIANGTVEINENGIKMADGASIIGGNGVLCNMQFFGKTSHTRAMYGIVGGYDSLGMECDEINSGTTMATPMIISPKFPDNFTIISAKVTLRHYPIKWYSDGSTGWGYARKLKLYQGISSEMYEDYNVYSGVILRDKAYSEITNAFGSNGWTPSTPTNSSQVLETKESIDVSNYLSNTEYLVVESADTVPTYTGNTAVDFKNCAQKTGMVSATLDVIGYLKI